MNNTTDSRLENTIVSDGLRSDAKFAIYALFMPVFCTLAIIGSSFAISVFVDIVRKERQSIHVYVLALVSVDALLMFVYLVRSIPVIIEAFSKPLGQKLQALMLAPVIYIDLLLLQMNVAILILLSIERLVSIRSPFAVNQSRLRKYSVQILVIVAVAIAVALLPLALSMEVSVSQGPNGTEVYQVVVRKDYEDVIAFFTIAETVVFKFLPYVLLALLNVGIIVQYKKVARKRLHILPTAREASVLRDQLRVTVSVSVFVGAYTVLRLPQMVTQVLAFADDTYSFYGRESNLFWLLNDISNVLIVINCAVDFVVYILRSGKFRDQFVRKFWAKSRTDPCQPATIA